MEPDCPGIPQGTAEHEVAHSIMGSETAVVYLRVEPLDQLFSRFRPALLAEGFRRTGSAEDAEDLAQETYVTAIRRAPVFESASAFLAWSRETVRRHAADRRRRLRRVPDPAPPDRRTSGATDLLDLALHAAELNPHESADAVACFIMHTSLGTGLRYLTYVLEEPRTTIARRFEGMKARMGASAIAAVDPIDVVNRLCDNLVRERLMDPRPGDAEAVVALPRELTLAALERWPQAQHRLAAQAVRNLAYVFRRYPAGPALSRELDEWRRSMKAGTGSRTAELAARYMLLRSADSADRSEWKRLHDELAAHPGYRAHPSRITAAGFAEGWTAAASLLRSLVPAGRVRRSFYLSFLAADFALREGRPRVAARHLEDIEESYCPGLLRPEVERRRERCRAAWRAGGSPVEERLPLLA